MGYTRWLFVVLAAGTMCAAGCSGESKLEGTVPVTGTVTQKGTPLAGASVMFSPAGQSSGRAAAAKTDDSGRFKLTSLQAGDGAMPGDYNVAITKTELVGKQYSVEEANEYYNKNQKQPPAPQRKELVAPKYGQASTSGLKASVKAGQKNDFTFDVE